MTPLPTGRQALRQSVMLIVLKSYLRPLTLDDTGFVTVAVINWPFS
jgi:hypothetical protein